MRVVAVLMLVAACSSAPAKKTTAPERSAPPAAERPPDEVFDDAVFVGRRGETEHIVITRTADGWIYDAEQNQDSGKGISIASVLHVEHDANGAFVRGTYDMQSPFLLGGATYHADFERRGSRVVATIAGTEFSTGAAELLHLQGIGVVAGMCREPGPRTFTVVDSPSIELGTAEPVSAEVRRIPLRLPDGDAELYCDGERMLGIDGPGDELAMRRDAVDQFTAVRRAPPEPPALPDGVTEVERTVESKGAGAIGAITLGCSLVQPTSKTRAPAVVFVSGGSNFDRDGDLVIADAHNRRHPHRRIAYALARVGVASLRCDTRGATAGAMDSSVESLVADGVAMFASLKAEDGIDRKRIGLLGFRDGATVAPRLWKETGTRTMAIVDANSVPFDVMATEVSAEQARKTPPTSAEAEAAMEALAVAEQKAFDALRAGEPLPADTPDHIRNMLELAPEYFRSYVQYDPSAAARTVTRSRVLIVELTFDATDVERNHLGDLEAAYGAAKGKKKNTVERKEYGEVDRDLVLRQVGEEGRKAPWWTPLGEQVIDDLVAFFGGALE